MSWFGSKTRLDGDARVEAIRSARKRQGHDLTALQEGIIRSIAGWEPEAEKTSKSAFDAVVNAVETSGKWQLDEEWRISTWFRSSIVESTLDGRKWFTASVTCDGQTLSCGCPSIERAYGFVRLYQKLIIDQFYSIGPPWSDRQLFLSST